MAINTSRDQDDDVQHSWSPAVITNLILLGRLVERGDPEALAQVLRPIAASLADKASEIRDPASVLLDLGRVADSMLTTISAVIRAWKLNQADDEETRIDVELALKGLRGVRVALHSLYKEAEFLAGDAS